MKKTLLSAILLFGGLTQFVSAQTNGGFENWTGNETEGWVSTNALTLLGNPQSVFKSSDAHTGSFACEINTIHVTNKIPGVSIPDYTGSVFTGKQVGFTPVFGFPFSSKPSTLSFWYKYNGRNGDSASILVYTSRWNSTTGKRDTLVLGAGFIKDSVGVYTRMDLPLITLDSARMPDTAVVLFASSTLSAMAAGAKLIIDDVAFAGGNVGLTDESGRIDVSVFPNPATKGSTTVVFSQPENNVSVKVYDLHGKLLTETLFNNTFAVLLDTGHLAKGLYFIHIKSDRGLATERLLVE